jgi:ubiquitin-protein ligase
MSSFQKESKIEDFEEEDFEEDDNYEYDYEEKTNEEDNISEFDKKNQILTSVQLLLLKKNYEENDRRIREEKKVATTGHSIEHLSKVKKSNCFSNDVSFQVLFNEFSRFKLEPLQDICIEILNNNLYHWKVYLRNFDYSSPFGIDLIEKNIEEVILEVEFVQDLYPFFPPRVTILTPRLKNNLLYHISNLFILRFENWIPTNNIQTILQDIKRILERFGRIDLESESIEFSSLEKHLLHLSFITDVQPQCIIYDDFITDSFYHELKTQINESKKIKTNMASEASAGSGSSNSKWAKGTGYGSGQSKYSEVWDVEKASILEEERDRVFFSLFDLIYEDIENELSKNNIDFIYSSIMNSSLITNIEHYLIQDSMISKSSIKVLSSFKILKIISSHPNLIFLIKRIYSQLFRIYLENKRIIEMTSQSTGDNDDGFEIIQTYYENLSTIVNLVQSMDLHDNFIDIQKESISLSVSDEFEAKYIHMMKEIQIGELNELPSYHYIKDLNANSSLSTLPRGLLQRISKEIISLNTSLPVSVSSTIWIKTMEDRFLYIQVMISGPEKTPYSGGLYLFDIYFPIEYPNVPPKVNLQTTGGGKVRFNPNLYNCGKVCLSLLGTWSGDNSEKWNPKVSTLLQVLISIQALILIDEPYFNEPGYQNSMGTPTGQAQSRAYNENIQKQNVRYAIIEQIKNPPRGYEEIIHKHFSLQKVRILDTIEKWKDGSTEWTQLYDEAKTLLDNLPEF